MQFFLTACALTGVVAQVSASFNDGYMNISNAKTPTQVHLAFSGANGMIVSWNTFAKEAKPRVHYGLHKNKMNMTAYSDVSVIYPTSLTYNNHVNITGLLPATTYWYQPVGAHENLANPEPYNFTTARSAGDMTPYTMAVIVDMGTFGPLGLSDKGGPSADPLRPGEQTTISAMAEQLDTYEFIAHPGDIAYADTWLKEELAGYLPNTTIANGSHVYEAILNGFFDEVESLSSQRPYMVSPGNHDSNCDNGGTKGYTVSICPVGLTNFTGYINHWRMPSGPSGGVGNMWYSYDYGMTHYVSVDTETDLGNLMGPDEGSPEESGNFGYKGQQLDWLKQDLAAVDRNVTPWVIVFGHRPFYVSNTDNSVNATKAFEPIFHEYNVDLYFCGHSHVYERNAPIFNGTVDPNELNNPTSTWYIVNGAAGHYSGLDTFTYVANFSRYQEDSEYSWRKITFHNCSHMTVDALYTANNTVFDSATLYKDRTC